MKKENVGKPKLHDEMSVCVLMRIHRIIIKETWHVCKPAMSYSIGFPAL